MKTTQFLLVLLGATVALAHFESGNNFCGDETQRKDNCKPLVTCPNHGDSSLSSSAEKIVKPPASTASPGSGNDCGSGSDDWDVPGSGSGNCSGSGSGVGSGSGSGSGNGEWESGQYCFLLEFFLNFTVTWEIDITIKEAFILWINETQINIVEDSSLTEYQILVEIWYSLQILFEQYQEIEVAIQFLYIGDWGYVCDLEGLALDLQTEFADITLEQVIEIDVSTGDCPLTAALKGCEKSATASEQTEIQTLVQKILVIIKGHRSFGESSVLIYEEFAAFFVQYPSLKALIFSGKIEKFGGLKSFFDLCNVYWRIDNFAVAVSGSTSSCELLQSLNAVWQNQSYNITQRQDIKQLYNKTATYFSTEVSIELRIQYFTEQLYQLLILAEWDIQVIYPIEIQGYGTIYDLIYAYIYCQNNGVGPGEFTASTESTTPSSTSTSTTTTGPSTTPAPVCANAWNVNTMSNNITLLINSIQTAQISWSSSENNTFLGYKKKIYNISANITAGYYDSQKFLDIKQVLLNFAGNTTTVYKKVQAVYISTWGYVYSYCACTSSGSTTINTAQVQSG
jgi:hypothetical protein